MPYLNINMKNTHPYTDLDYELLLANECKKNVKHNCCLNTQLFLNTVKRKLTQLLQFFYTTYDFLFESWSLESPLQLHIREITWDCTIMHLRCERTVIFH
jgi:hypothetical protein